MFEESSNFPPRITPKAARVNAGMSQKEAAKALGISVETLQNYESGATIPAWDKVAAMENVYRYPAAYMNFSCLANPLKAYEKG